MPRKIAAQVSLTTFAPPPTSPKDAPAPRARERLCHSYLSQRAITMQKAATLALRLLDEAVVWIATGAFIVMMLAVIGQVFFRYVLEIAVPWTEELARLLFVESMLLSMAVAIRQHEHIVVDFLFNKLSPRLRNIVGALFNLAIIVLLVLLMRGSWDLLMRNWNAQLVSLPWVRVGYVYLGLFISLGLMAFYTALNMTVRLRQENRLGTQIEKDT